MLHGTIDVEATYAAFTSHPVLIEALRWLRDAPAGLERGIHPLRGDDVFANVHGYETRPRAQCRYECHRRYVDIQYCVSGGEIIEWHPESELAPTDAYDQAKDVIHYAWPAVPTGRVRLAPRAFVMFLPGEAHMPKIANENDPAIAKIVIKLDHRLLA